jgi:hypothetical protein
MLDFMDAVKELYSHYERVKAKIEEYEKKPILDNRQQSAYLQWVALGGVLIERIFDLEHRDRFHGYDSKEVESLKNDLFAGDWASDLTENKQHRNKDFRQK